MNKIIFDDTAGTNELNEREKSILRTIIHLYLLNASPVGSRNISKYLERELKLSPATIRNVMADLEEKDFISHLHTSAGRFPTDKGYRYYVDSLMKLEQISENEKITVKKNLNLSNPEDMLKDVSRIIGMISRYLGFVELPNLKQLILIKIELIPLSTNRILAVLALDSNIVKTITMEADFEINQNHLLQINQLLNEKISGKPINYISEHFNSILIDHFTTSTPLVRLFIDSIDSLFKKSNHNERVILSGTQNLLSYPEFEDLSKVKGVIELIENEDMIIHLLDEQKVSDETVKILIGKELNNQLFDDYSIVVTNYHIGSANGSVGLIGPKRMNYSKIISLLSYISHFINKKV
jgi:heat-inducible transcriptional repressor